MDKPNIEHQREKASGSGLQTAGQNPISNEEKHALFWDMLVLRANAKNIEEYRRADRVIQAILQEAELATNGTNDTNESFRERLIEK